MATSADTYTIGFTAGSGNKEDVLDMVINIDPFDTPFTTTAPKTTASLTTHEWLQDTLPTTSTAGAAEGADFGTPDMSGRSRITNITQIFRQDIQVTNTQRAVRPFGIKDEYAYQIMKATRAIARNIENTVFSTAASAAVTGSAGSARTLVGLEGFYTTNAPWARGTALGNSATDSTATSYPVLEGDFNAMLELIYTQGGNPDAVYVSPAVKRIVSKYGGARTETGAEASTGFLALRRDISAAERRLVRAINVYGSDFGDIQIVLDRWVPQSPQTAATAIGAANLVGRMYFVERARNRLAFLRPVKHVPIASVGDATRGIVLGELTLEVLAEKGSGMIKAVSPRDDL